MATPLAELGQNTEIDENSSGETIIRNTQTGTEVRLADFVDIVGPLGDSSNPVAGTSHFESVNTEDATVDTQLTAPASIPSDETANRSIGTWYQNTSGSWLLVVATVQADADNIDMAVLSHVNTSQSNNPQDYSTVRDAMSSGTSSRTSVMAWVPDGQYYRVTQFADTADFSLLEWNESTVGVN